MLSSYKFLSIFLVFFVVYIDALHKCPKNEIFIRRYRPEANCAQDAPKNIIKDKICTCLPNLVRNGTESCILKSKCPICEDAYEFYSYCAKEDYLPGDTKPICKSGCKCKDGYVRNQMYTCVSKDTPELVVLQTKKSSIIRFDLVFLTQCTPTWSKQEDLTWHIVKAIFLYTLPLMLMTIAYCQIVRVLWKSDNIPGHCESHKYATASTPPNYIKHLNGAKRTIQRQLPASISRHLIVGVPEGSNWSRIERTNRRNTVSTHANTSTEGQLRSRRKAAKMLVAVVVMFAVCYLPVHLLSVLRYASGMQQTDEMTFFALLSHWLCYANSAVNPLIYNFMSGKFRREFRRSFFKCSCFGLGSGRSGGYQGQAMTGNRGTVSRAGTRKSESCASYKLAHLSPPNFNGKEREFVGRTSFIENNNSGRKANRSDSLSEDPMTRLTIAADMDSRQ